MYREWVVVHKCVRDIEFVSFYSCSVIYRNCLDSVVFVIYQNCLDIVVFVVFHFIIYFVNHFYLYDPCTSSLCCVFLFVDSSVIHAASAWFSWSSCLCRLNFYKKKHENFKQPFMRIFGLPSWLGIVILYMIVSHCNLSSDNYLKYKVW